jgi:hypothetical protein
LLALNTPFTTSTNWHNEVYAHFLKLTLFAPPHYYNGIQFAMYLLY